MPRLNDGLENHATGHYGFSATPLSDLGATEYTLVSIVSDGSTSVGTFINEMTDAVKEIFKSCKLSPRADNLMIRLVQFADDVEEIHGFKLLSECNLSDYDHVLEGCGNTALFDAAENAIASTAAYGKKLKDEGDFNSNAIVFVLTDGCDNRSKLSRKAVKDAMLEALKKENLESIVSILIGVDVTSPQVSKHLNEFQDQANFTKYIELGDAKASTMAKLAEFVSKSISAQSQSLGTGGASQQIPSLAI